MALEARGKVSLDGSGFSKTIGGLGTQITGLSNKVKAQLGGAFLATFGASRIIAFGKELLADGERIDSLAHKFKLTSTQVQQLEDYAKSTGTTFESLVSDTTKLEETLKRVADAPVLFSKENLDTLRAFNEGADEFTRSLKEQIVNGSLLNDALFNLTGGAFGKAPAKADNALTARQEEFLAKEAEDQRKIAATKKDQADADKIMLEVAELMEKARIKALTDEERQNELVKERRRLISSIENPKRTISETAEAQAVKRIAEIDLELAKKPKEEPKPEAPATSQPVNFGLNQFQQIGGFAGQNPLLNLSQRQLIQLGIIARNTQPRENVDGFH